MLDTAPKPRVAVIDDDAGFAMSMATLLDSGGFDASLFESAESFIAADETPSFRCLLIDWLLPGMSGATLCDRLAAQEHHPAMILMSGTRFTDNRMSERLPADVEFMRKPFDPEWLLAELAAICERPE